MPITSDPEFERRMSSRLLDVLITGGLIAALMVLCYRIFSPFLGLMVWGMILAVTLYPIHQRLARKMGGRQGKAATLLLAPSSFSSPPAFWWFPWATRCKP